MGVVQDTHADQQLVIKELRHAKALKQYQLGNYVRALKILQPNLDVVPPHLPSLEVIARSHEQLKEYTKALRVYYYLIKYSHNDNILKIRDKDKLEDEIQKLKSMTLNEGFKEYIFKIATIYKRLYVEAKNNKIQDIALRLSLKYFELSRTLEHRKSESSIHLGTLYKASGKKRSSVKAFITESDLYSEEDFAKNPSNNLIKYHLADALYLEGYDHLAMKLIKSIETSPYASEDLKSYVNQYYRFMSREKMGFYAALGLGTDSNTSNVSQDTYNLVGEDVLGQKSDSFQIRNFGIDYNTEKKEEAQHFINFNFSEQLYSNADLKILNLRTFSLNYKYFFNSENDDYYFQANYLKAQSPRDLSASYKDATDILTFKAAMTKFHDKLVTTKEIIAKQYKYYISNEDAKSLGGKIRFEHLIGSEYFSPYYSLSYARFLGTENNGDRHDLEANLGNLSYLSEKWSLNSALSFLWLLADKERFNIRGLTLDFKAAYDLSDYIRGLTLQPALSYNNESYDVDYAQSRSKTVMQVTLNYYY